MAVRARGPRRPRQPYGDTVSRIKVLVADQHEVVRTGVRRLLEGNGKYEVVAEAANSRQAVEKAIEKTPDVAILEHSPPLLDGLEAGRQIRVNLPNTEVCLFTANDRNLLLRDAIQAGIHGYVLKANPEQRLVEAVNALALHRPYFCPEAAEMLVDDFVAKGNLQERLTPREKQIVRLIADGHSTKSIANLLGISPKTVETHRHAIMWKLDLKNTTDLVRYAVRNGIVEE
jgi:DNA-binding NarL/FixJ family response regulator